MTVQAQLDELRAAIPGCTLVAYGDRAARLVLRTSAAVAWRQELLDRLCARGAHSLTAAEQLDVRLTGVGEPPDVPSAKGCEAVVATDGDVRVFVGADRADGEVLCCVLAPGADTHVALAKARAVLDRLPDTVG